MKIPHSFENRRLLHFAGTIGSILFAAALAVGIEELQHPGATQNIWSRIFTRAVKDAGLPVMGLEHVVTQYVERPVVLWSPSDPTGSGKNLTNGQSAALQWPDGSSSHFLKVPTGVLVDYIGVTPKGEWYGLLPGETVQQAENRHK